MTFKAPEIADDGVAIWHARTVPELADAVRWLAGKLSAVEVPTPPDLSGYATTEDLTALETTVTDLGAQLATLQGQVVDLEARVVALETPVP